MNNNTFEIYIFADQQFPENLHLKLTITKYANGVFSNKRSTQSESIELTQKETYKYNGKEIIGFFTTEEQFQSFEENIMKIVVTKIEVVNDDNMNDVLKLYNFTISLRDNGDSQKEHDVDFSSVINNPDSDYKIRVYKLVEVSSCSSELEFNLTVDNDIEGDNKEITLEIIPQLMYMMNRTGYTLGTGTGGNTGRNGTGGNTGWTGTGGNTGRNGTGGNTGGTGTGGYTGWTGTGGNTGGTGTGGYTGWTGTGGSSYTSGNYSRYRNGSLSMGLQASCLLSSKNKNHITCQIETETSQQLNFTLNEYFSFDSDQIIFISAENPFPLYCIEEAPIAAIIFISAIFLFVVIVVVVVIIFINKKGRGEKGYEKPNNSNINNVLGISSSNA